MKVVIGQGSCGIATGAKKTAAEFEKQIADKNLGTVTVGDDRMRRYLLSGTDRGCI